MIPDKNQQEWGDLLTDQIKPRISCLSLQMKVNSLKFAVKYNKIDLKTAISDIHNFCVANEQKYQNDVNIIFNLN